MNRILAALAILLFSCSLACAQKNAERKPISDEERAQWLGELREYKHEYLARELNLTQQQQESFFPVYDEMDDALNKIAADTRALEDKVAADADASDIEIEAASRALFEQRSREGEVDKEYFDKLKEILTPRQLLMLKNSERKFTQQLVRRHGKTKAAPRR